ncbi:alpha/beta hydrolase [Pseudomonas sp. HN11]|uniref:alpha/beta fold hydrolase n=1 Tax=Pseudomonas sp. HN11 TaxID=1344094 RepID=UPI001F49280C|nr:alpha/beta hydrolase [Pseudomonas sp. HN11]UII69867.1 alpha/beta hydrolase [Pseudomonas sp. HN11]
MKVLPGLARHARIMPVDFSEDDQIEKMAERVLDIAPDRFSLAGHSMGARVALEVYHRAPQRITRIALLSTGVHPVKPGESKLRQALVDIAYQHGMAAVMERWLPPMLLAMHAQNADFVEPLREMVLRMTPDILARQIKALLNRADASQQLLDITCPTLIGVGRQDAWSPVAQHEFIACRVTGSHFRVFEKSGHMAPFEAPLQVENALVDWLRLSHS